MPVTPAAAPAQSPTTPPPRPVALTPSDAAPVPSATTAAFAARAETPMPAAAEASALSPTEIPRRRPAVPPPSPATAMPCGCAIASIAGVPNPRESATTAGPPVPRTPGPENTLSETPQTPAPCSLVPSMIRPMIAVPSVLFRFSTMKTVRSAPLGKPSSRVVSPNASSWFGLEIRMGSPVAIASLLRSGAAPGGGTPTLRRAPRPVKASSPGGPAHGPPLVGDPGDRRTSARRVERSRLVITTISTKEDRHGHGRERRDPSLPGRGPAGRPRGTPSHGSRRPAGPARSSSPIGRRASSWRRCRRSPATGRPSTTGARARRG